MNRPSGKAPRSIAKRAQSRIRKRKAGNSPPAKKRRVHKRGPVPLEGRAAYTFTEFGKLIGCSRITIWRRARAGQLQTTTVLGRELVPATELKRLGLAPE